MCLDFFKNCDIWSCRLYIRELMSLSNKENFPNHCEIGTYPKFKCVYHTRGIPN